MFQKFTLFAARDAVYGNELWVTDGTTAGTSMLLDINPGYASSNPSDIVSLGNGKALFSASNGTTGYELWITDGTAAGTYMVKDINPTAGAVEAYGSSPND